MKEVKKRGRKPKQKPIAAEVQAPALEPSLESFANRSGLRLLQRAVNNNWEIPDYVVSGIPKLLAQLLANPKAHMRDRLRLIEVIATLARDNINLAVSLDRVERLEAGKATDHVIINQEIRDLADKIIQSRITK